MSTVLGSFPSCPSMLFIVDMFFLLGIYALVVVSVRKLRWRLSHSKSIFEVYFPSVTTVFC